MTLSEIFEALNAVGLFISVALVYTELRRNGATTRIHNSMLFTERHFNLRNLTINQDLADVIVRGRQGLEYLSKTEQLMFTSYLLNAAQTASMISYGGAGRGLSSKIAHHQTSNIIRGEWENQGDREYWDKIKNDPAVVPQVRDMIKRVLEQ